MAAAELGGLLRERREAGDVTRRELAIAAGLDASAVAKIEREGRTRASTVRRLARALAELSDDLDGQALTAELLAAAGDDLASESAYPGHAERIERRRDERAAPDRARALADTRRAHRRLDDALAAGDMEAVGRIVAEATGRVVDVTPPRLRGGRR